MILCPYRQQKSCEGRRYGLSFTALLFLRIFLFTGHPNVIPGRFLTTPQMIRTAAAA